MECNNDCFNCKFDDCILDSSTITEFEPLDDAEQKAYAKKQLLKQRRHDYYIKHKETIVAQATNWNKTHPERHRINALNSKRRKQERNKLNEKDV